MAAAAPTTARERAAGVVCSLGLGAYWVYGYRRGRFALALELVEVAAAS